MKKKLEWNNPKYLLSILGVTLFLAYICEDNGESFPHSFMRTLIITSGTYYFLPLGELRKQLSFDRFLAAYKKMTLWTFCCIWITASLANIYDLYAHHKISEIATSIGIGLLVATFFISFNVIASTIIFKPPTEEAHN